MQEENFKTKSLQEHRSEMENIFKMSELLKIRSEWSRGIGLSSCVSVDGETFQATACVSSCWGIYPGMKAVLVKTEKYKISEVR